MVRVVPILEEVVMRPSRSGSLAAALLALVFAFAGCEAEPPTAPPLDSREAGPLAPAATEIDVDFEVVNIDTSLGWGIVRFEGLPCQEDLRLLRVGTPFSDELARTIAAAYLFPPGDPPFGDLLLPHGSLTNLEFLTGDLPQFGNAGDQIYDAVWELVADLEAALGVTLHVEPTGGLVETGNFSLFGGILRPDGSQVLPGDPDYDDPFPDVTYTAVLGQANVDFYGLEFRVGPVDGALGGSCLSAREEKEAARDLLADLDLATHPEKKVRKRIEKALDHLERSLDPVLWLDDAHLDPKRGKKVFDREKKAAHEVLKLLKKATDGDDDSDDDSSDDGSGDDVYDLDPATLADHSDGVIVTGTLLLDLYALEFEVSPVGAVTGGTCLTARSHKEAARDRLLPHATHPEKKVRKRVEKALDRLERSLDPALWDDDAHLDARRGKKVFDHEKKAAHEILKLLEKATDGDDDSSDDNSSDDGSSDAYDLAPATIADLEAALEKMLAADRALASTAMGEVDCAGDRKCAKELSKAGERFERAERYAAEGRIDKAIGELKKAWEEAVKAAR